MCGTPMRCWRTCGGWVPRSTSAAERASARSQRGSHASRPPSEPVAASGPMRVALAEDGALFREGLEMLLQAAGHEVVGSTADGDALVELLAEKPADAAILDIRMPP